MNTAFTFDKTREETPVVLSKAGVWAMLKAQVAQHKIILVLLYETSLWKPVCVCKI
jgi:hypothetical protein